MYMVLGGMRGGGGEGERGGASNGLYSVISI